MGDEIAPPPDPKYLGALVLAGLIPEDESWSYKKLMMRSPIPMEHFDASLLNALKVGMIEAKFTRRRKR